MKTIYLAYSVTKGNQNLDKANSLVSWLRKRRYRVLQPKYALFNDSLAQDSMQSIIKCDVIIADVTMHSHGVGFELGYAYALQKNIVVISNASARNKISKFILALFPGIIFYRDESDLIMEITHELQRIFGKYAKTLSKARPSHKFRGDI